MKKKVYLNNFLYKTAYRIASVLFLFLAINPLITEGFSFETFAFLFPVIFFAIVTEYSNWALGIFANAKKDTLTFRLRVFSASNYRTYRLSEMKSIRIEKQSEGFMFTLIYKDGRIKNFLFYLHFKELTILSQYKRIKRQIEKLNRYIAYINNI